MRTGARLASVGVLWAGSFAVLRLSALAPEVCPEVEPSELEQAAVEAGEWIVRTQADDGRYLYEYHRGDDEVAPGYNIVRHAGVTMSLYQLARAGHDDFVASADRGMDRMLADLVPAGDGSAYTDVDTQARLGASALMAVALSQRREATGSGQHDEQLRALGRFLVGQITDGGQMLNLFDLRAGAPVAGQTSLYSTGEAAWALAQLHNHFPDEGWDVPAFQVLDYLATRRDDVERTVLPPWADQWAAYTLAELAGSGLDADHISYARSLAARFVMLLRVESQKGGWPIPFVDTRARGAGLGVWVEGLGGLAHASRVDARLADVGTELLDRMTCGGALIEERQQDRADAARWPSPARVEGAWFLDDVTRMDDQQHALSGLLVAAGELGPVGGGGG